MKTLLNEKSKRSSSSAKRRILLVFVLTTLTGIILVGLGLQYSLERVDVSRPRVNLEVYSGPLAPRGLRQRGVTLSLAMTEDRKGVPMSPTIGEAS